MKQEDYSSIATEVLDRAMKFVGDLPKHIPDDDPKCDEYGNVTATGQGWAACSTASLQHDTLAEKSNEDESSPKDRLYLRHV